jgi:RNA polymerase sigma-70 factor (ECF subfamily)
MTTRLAINLRKAAPTRRELYVGLWLHEPVDTGSDPELRAERGEALSFALLMLLERLSPAERAAYVLREAFDYPYAQIADILETTEANVRQMVSRGRKHLRSHRREPVDAAEHRRLLDAFVRAAQDGDLRGLEAVLADGVVSRSDGAGIVKLAARRPMEGREQVARFIAGFKDIWWPGTTVSWVETNGRPSVLITRGDEPAALLSIGASAEGIEQIMWVMVPSKLTSLGPNGVRS